jgi:hypothetical protein
MTLSSRQTGPRISASRCPTKNRALTVAVNAAGNLNRATADLELGRSPGLVAAFLFSLLVVALLLAALFDVVLFPFSALLVVALLLAALLLVALFFASCFGVVSGFSKLSQPSVTVIRLLSRDQNPHQQGDLDHQPVTSTGGRGVPPDRWCSRARHACLPVGVRC